MKRLVLLLPAPILLLGCTSPLDPADGLLDEVAARATHSIDVNFVGPDQENFPARIYYNDAAEGMIPAISAELTVITSASERGHAPLGETNAASEDFPVDGEIAVANRVVEVDETGSLAPPEWFYVRIGEGDRGSTAEGWSLPFSAIGSSLNRPGKLEPDEVDPHHPDPSASAKSHTVSFSVGWLSNTASYTSASTSCTLGGRTNSITGWTSYGNGRLELWKSTGPTQIGLDYFSGPRDLAEVTNQGENDNYYARFKHTSSTAIYGNGSVICY